GLVYEVAQKRLGPNLLFAFSSDHGAQLPFGKWNCYDAGVQVPLIVTWPGQVKAGSRTNALVSWIDLLPTVLAACGGAPPKDISGVSFLDVLAGKNDQPPDKRVLTHRPDR